MSELSGLSVFVGSCPRGSIFFFSCVQTFISLVEFFFSRVKIFLVGQTFYLSVEYISRVSNFSFLGSKFFLLGEKR